MPLLNEAGALYALDQPVKVAFKDNKVVWSGESYVGVALDMGAVLCQNGALDEVSQQPWNLASQQQEGAGPNPSLNSIEPIVGASGFQLSTSAPYDVGTVPRRTTFTAWFDNDPDFVAIDNAARPFIYPYGNFTEGPSFQKQNGSPSFRARLATQYGSIYNPSRQWIFGAYWYRTLQRVGSWVFYIDGEWTTLQARQVPDLPIPTTDVVATIVTPSRVAGLAVFNRELSFNEVDRLRMARK
jgi:hypothetical protein